MKILFCSNEQLMPLLGGGTAGNLRILQKMVHCGHDVTAVTPLYIDKEPVEKRLGIRIEPCSPFYIHRTASRRELRYAAFILLFTLKIRRMLKRENFDCLFLRNCTLGLGLALALRRSKIPLIISMTDFISGFLYEDERYPQKLVDYLVKLEKKVARSADKLFVVTERMKNAVINGTFHDPQKVFTAGDGVDTVLFNPDKYSPHEKEMRRKELGLESEEVIVYHGIIDPYHGLNVLPSIIRKTLDKKDVRFLVIAEGEGYRQLQEKIRDKRVIFLNFLPYEKIADYLSIARVGMVPYKPNFNLNMVYTLKFLEYLAMGIPVVCFNLKSVEDRFGQQNYVYLSQNENQFSDNLIKALETPRSNSSIDLIRKEFSWDVVTERIIAEIEKNVVN